MRLINEKNKSKVKQETKVNIKNYSILNYLSTNKYL